MSDEDKERESKTDELLKEGQKLTEKVEKEISGTKYRHGYSSCCNARIIKAKGGVKLPICSRCGRRVSMKVLK
jgi:hypothetical protein